MPRFDDGMVNMAEPIGAMVESLINETMDAQADEAREAGNRRNGWSLVRQGEFQTYRTASGRTFAFYDRPQHFSVWRYGPAT